jgi:hypothetical protein
MKRCIQGYSNVLSMDITPSESFTRHELSELLGTPLVDEHMKNAPAGVQDTMYSLVCYRAGFTIHQTGVGGLKLSSPTCVFSAELSALFMALRHIREVIQYTTPKKNS